MIKAKMTPEEQKTIQQRIEQLTDLAGKVFSDYDDIMNEVITDVDLFYNLHAMKFDAVDKIKEIIDEYKEKLN